MVPYAYAECIRAAPFDVGPRVHADFDTPEILRGAGGGIYQREECHLHRSDVYGQAAKLHRREFLGAGILRLNGRTRRKEYPGVHQEPRARRPEDRPTQHVQQVATSSGSQTQTALSGSQHQASGFAGGLMTDVSDRERFRQAHLGWYASPWNSA
jgi:hypothetical protein